MPRSSSLMSSTSGRSPSHSESPEKKVAVVSLLLVVVVLFLLLLLLLLFFVVALLLVGRFVFGIFYWWCVVIGDKAPFNLGSPYHNLTITTIPNLYHHTGPLYSLKLSPRASDHSTDGLSVSYVGSPREVSGVMGPALSFDGRDDYVIIDQKGKPSCFSDLSLCLYGLRVATWLKMKEAEADVFDSGVLRLSVRNNKVLLEASRGAFSLLASLFKHFLDYLIDNY